jgi:endonuclease/exonuclease/phosphatase family metal-dependent hydrolase
MADMEDKGFARFRKGRFFKPVSSASEYLSVGCLNIHLGRFEKRQIVYSWVSRIVKLDVCVITETRFREGVGDSLMGEVINPEEYAWYGRDRKAQRSLSGEGGVGILIKKNIGTAKVVKVSKLWDMIWVKISLNGENIMVGGIYLSPADTTRETDIATFVQELETDIYNFRRIGKVIIMGDLNSRIGTAPSTIFGKEKTFSYKRSSEDEQKKMSRAAKRQAKQILDSLNASSMVVLNGTDGGGECTFVQGKGKSMIDFIILDNRFLCEEEIEEDESGLDRKYGSGPVCQSSGRNQLEMSYMKGSLKVWGDFLIQNDHRLISCKLPCLGVSRN